MLTNCTGRLARCALSPKTAAHVIALTSLRRALARTSPLAAAAAAILVAAVVAVIELINRGIYIYCIIIT